MMGTNIKRLFFVTVLVLLVVGFFSISSVFAKKNKDKEYGTSSGEGYHNWNYDDGSSDGKSHGRSDDDSRSGHKKKPKKHWRTDGNAHIDHDIHFLGTTDEADLVIKTNNDEKVRVTTDGDVGIGTGTPTGTLHVVGGEAAADADGKDITIEAQDGGLDTGAGNNAGGNIVLTPGIDSNGTSIGTVYVGEVDSLDTEKLVLDVNGQIRIKGGTPFYGAVLMSDIDGTASWEAIHERYTNEEAILAVEPFHFTNADEKDLKAIAKLTLEEAAREAADAVLQNNIDDEEADRIAGDDDNLALINTNAIDIGTNSTDINTNATDISTNSTDINTIENNYDSTDDAWRAATAPGDVTISGNVGIGTGSPDFGLVSGRSTGFITSSGWGRGFRTTSGNAILWDRGSDTTKKHALLGHNGEGFYGALTLEYDQSTPPEYFLRIDAVTGDWRFMGKNLSQIGTLATTGSVGIGTSSPGAKLDIAGNIKIVDGNQGTDKVLTSDANGLAQWKDAFSLWSTDGSNVYRSTGNVGIGATALNSRLSFGKYLDDKIIGLWDDSNDWYGLGIQSHEFKMQIGNSNARFSFVENTSGSELVSIKGSGNVGIGNANPGSKLDVTGNIAVSGTVDGIDVSAHAGNPSAHHTPYTDADAIAAVGDHTVKYTNAEAIAAVAPHHTTDTDDQNLTLLGTTLSIDDGNSVALGALQDGTGTDDQQLSFVESTSTLNLEDGGSVILNGLSDNLGDHKATQTLNLDGNWLSGDGGAEGVFVDNAGKVGIGMTNPGEKLHLSGGDIRIDDGSPDGFGSSRIFFAEGSGVHGGLLKYDSDNDIMKVGTVNVAGDELGLSVRRENGNVGIGTTNPIDMLTVAGNIVPSDSDQFSLGTLNNVWQDVYVGNNSLNIGGTTLSNATGILQWGGLPLGIWSKNGSSTYYNGGNVGIGTDTPQGILDVLTSANGTVTGFPFSFMNTNAGGHGMLISAGGPLVDHESFSINNQAGTRLFSVRGNGNVGIGPMLSPGTALEVGGTGWMKLNSDNPVLFMYDANGPVDKRQFYLNNQADFNGSVVGRWVNDANTGGIIKSIAFKNNGNVGIGNESPSKKLDVTGDINFTGDLYQNGTLFGGSVWSKNGLMAFYNAGNVGIGTNSPGSLLHVAGPSVTWGDLAKFERTATGESDLVLKSGGQGWISLLSDGGFIFNTGITTDLVEANILLNNPRVVIDKTGKVGIGTLVPESLLTLASSSSNPTLSLTPLASGVQDPVIELHGETAFTNEGFSIRYDNSIGDVYFNQIYTGITGSTPAMRFSTGNSADAMVIAGSGNVGIGTTSPSGTLDVSTASTTGSTNLLYLTRGSGFGGTYFKQFYTDVNNHGLSIGWASDRLTINHANGNVGIGTSTPGGLLGLKDGSTFLDVDGSNNLTFTDSVTGTKTLAELVGGGGLWSTDGSSVYRSAGNVGIGTASPLSSLHVQATGNGWLTVSTANAIVGSGQSDYGIRLSRAPTLTTGNEWDITSGYPNRLLRFRRFNPTNNNLIDHPLVIRHDNGNVGIGTTTPNQKLEVNGNIRLNKMIERGVTNNLLQIRGGTSLTDGAGLDLYGINTGVESGNFYPTIPLPSSKFQLYVTSNASRPFTILGTGKVGIGTTSPGGLLGLNDSNTFLDVDSSNNLTFTDSVTGTKTLAELVGGAGGLWNLNVNNLYYNTGNVGIGTAIPNQKLEVNGNIAAGHRWGNTGNTASNTADVNIGKLDFNGAWNDGSAFIRFKDNSNDGTVNAGTGIAFHSHKWGGGTREAMRITGSRNVGIGTTSPGAKLEVVGTGQISNGSGYAPQNNKMASGSLTIGGINSSYGGGQSWNTNTAGLLLETLTNTEIAVHDAGSRITSLMYYEGDANNRITIGRNMGWGTISKVAIHGDVGIGTTSPGWKLHLAGSNSKALAGRQQLSFIGTTTNEPNPLGILLGVDGGPNSNERIAWLQSTEENSTINSFVLQPYGGKVGIGTTDPQKALHVKSTAFEGMRIEREGSSGGAFLEFENSDNNIGGIGIGLDKSMFIKTPQIGDGSAFIVENTGDVGIGTLTPNNKLDIGGISGHIGYGLAVNGERYGAVIKTWSDGASIPLLIVNSDDSNNQLFRIGGDGNAELAGTLSQLSDARLKSDVTEISDAIDIISAIRGVRYYWNDNLKRNPSRQVGVIAQDVEKVLPEAVHTDEDGFKSVYYSGLIGPMIEAIKELKSENDLVKSENSQLKEKLATLTERQSAIEEMLLALSTDLPLEKLVKLGSFK